MAGCINWFIPAKVGIGALLVSLSMGPAWADGHGARFLIGDVPVEIGYGGLIDVRGAWTDETEDWVDGGFKSHVRYGSGDGDRELQADLAEATLILDGRIGSATSFFIQGQYEPDQHHPVDLVEAFAEYEPVSSSRWQYRVKAGTFFPKLSLEHEGFGWTSPYTITPSAINGWIGEEVRSTGLELGLDYRFNEWSRLRFSLAGFVFNDPSGVLLTYRGWSLSDRKSGLFDDIAVPVEGNIRDLRPFLELDDNVGIHGGVTYEDEDWGEIGFFAYDNLGDPRATRDGQGAWRTRFVNVGAKAFLPYDFEILSQAMVGQTEVFPGGIRDNRLGVEFRSFYVMLSRPVGDDHRVSLRYDRFLLNDVNTGANGAPPHDQEGNGLTAAWLYYPADNMRLSAEVLYAESFRADRLSYNVPAELEELLFQVSYRFYF